MALFRDISVFLACIKGSERACPGRCKILKVRRYGMDIGKRREMIC